MGPFPMYKPCSYLVVTSFPTYLPIYETYFLQNWFTKMKPNINSVEVHPQLSNNGHPVDGAPVGAGSTELVYGFTLVTNYVRNRSHI
jgi:hypothetical protein